MKNKEKTEIEIKSHKGTQRIVLEQGARIVTHGNLVLSKEYDIIIRGNVISKEWIYPEHMPLYEKRDIAHNLLKEYLGEWYDTLSKAMLRTLIDVIIDFNHEIEEQKS